VRLRNFSPDMVLERKVRSAITGGESLSGFVASVAASTPTPGGGSIAAHAGALGAALAQMVAGLTVGKKKYAAVDAEMRDLAVRAAGIGNTLAALVARDAASFTAVTAAYKLPADDEGQQRARTIAVDEALLGAAAVPLETARACAQVAELALAVAERGNSNAVTDAGVAALLAEAGCVGASYNVRVNVSSLGDRSAGEVLASEVKELVTRTRELVARTTEIVEKALA
jgi:glutamate formiminotransferase/formiminotetrahydrofolate cyclodeaminase